ncbi:glycoside hydrolase family 127 protein [bacterium]|nr:glycoside hydrolase family 127 protein [bacterium]
MNKLKCERGCVVYPGILLLLILSCRPEEAIDPEADYPIQPVSFTQVQLTDHFWQKRIKTNREITIPFGFNKCEEEGRIRNFAKAAGLMEGDYEGKMPFDDTDVYKIIEGASYALNTHPDQELEAYIDSIIEKIAAAQEDDGYLCTWKILNPDAAPAPWVNPGPRWHHLGASHELYNAGHLYEAAYAHVQATGKHSLLDVTLKNANLIAQTFGPGKIMIPPGHQIIETGLVKLYRMTADRTYLDLARFFLDQRGNAAGHTLYGPYSQDHLPVTEQKEAVGHAVRAVYMYAGMADIAAMMQDSAYLKAVDRLWENVVNKKLYITGGIGARHKGESFGSNYELPNLTSYNETCAAIGNIYWNHRMFLLHGDAKYIDVLERTLYNGMISGVSMSGDLFFYPNCLESDGKYLFNHGRATRQPWFDCSCCPTNVTRFIPSVPGYLYAHCGDTLYVNLFVSSNAHIEMDAASLDMTQKTQYPWDGKVILTVTPRKQKKFTVKIRIPGWAAGRPLPGDLYHYANVSSETTSLKVNGEPIPILINRGFAAVEREWKKGDVIELEFPMPVRRVIAHEKVKTNRNKVALVRGPLVYCAEWPDHEGHVLNLAIPDSSVLQVEHRPDFLGGIDVIRGRIDDRFGKETTLSAIPYYAWSHRGPGEMEVWINRQ